jgi:hypothetical protein
MKRINYFRSITSREIYSLDVMILISDKNTYFSIRNNLIRFHLLFLFNKDICYERTRDQGTLGSIAIAIVEPLGGHLFMYLIGHIGEPPRGGSAPTNIT